MEKHESFFPVPGQAINTSETHTHTDLYIHQRASTVQKSCYTTEDWQYRLVINKTHSNITHFHMH